MKKILMSLILSVIIPMTLCVSSLASDDVIVDIDLDNYEITVSGNLGSDAAGRMVTLTVITSNASLPDTQEKDAGFIGDIADFLLTYADENGEYEFDAFQLFKNSGDYVLKVAASNGTPKSTTKYLPSKTQFDKIVEDVSHSDADTIFATLKAAEDDILKVADLSLYYSFSETEQKKICAKIENAPYSNLGDIVEDLMMESAICEIMSTKSAQTLYDYLYLDESDFDETFKQKANEILDFGTKKKLSVFSDFDKLKEAQKEEILQEFAKTERKDLDDFYDKLAISTINYLFDNVDNWSEISNYIDRYSKDVLDTLIYDEYEESDYRSDIDKSLIHKAFESVDKLCEYINEYEPSDEEEEEEGFGSQSTGSKGSGGGGFSSYVPVIPEADTQPQSAFSDIEGYDWAKNEITYLYNKGVINGNGNGEFCPDNYVTREEFVKMLVVAANLSETSHYDFCDVDVKNWAYPYIMKAVTAGVVKGVSDTEFGMGRNITREDMTVLAARILGGTDTHNGNISFTDSADIAHYALSSVANMNEKKILNGYNDGSFKPKALSTRAEAAVVIYRVINALGTTN